MSPGRPTRPETLGGHDRDHSVARTRPRFPPSRPRFNPATPIAGPYTLRIPRIGVDAPRRAYPEQRGPGTQAPTRPQRRRLVERRRRPGEPQGSAVLVGHTVRNKGGGVFDDMGDLTRGDAIEVEGSDAALTYHVESIDVLSKDEVARDAEQIFNQTGLAGW